MLLLFILLMISLSSSLSTISLISSFYTSLYMPISSSTTSLYNRKCHSCLATLMEEQQITITPSPSLLSTIKSIEDISNYTQYNDELLSLSNKFDSNDNDDNHNDNNDNKRIVNIRKKWSKLLFHKFIRGGQTNGNFSKNSIISLVTPSELVYLKKSVPRDEEGVLIAAILNLFQNKNISNHLNDIKAIIKTKLQTAKVKGVLLKSSIKSSVGLKSLIKVKYLAINSTEVIKRGITPILVFVNHKSGGQYGKKLVTGLRKILHYTQICDLSVHAPSYYLNLYKDVPLRCILCCGGDGTVGWIMDEKKLIPSLEKVPIGVIPLGTGNDLHNQLMTDLVKDRSKNDEKLFKTLKRMLSAAMDPSLFSSNPTAILSLYSPERSCITSTLDRWALTLGPVSNNSFVNDMKISQEKSKIRKALSQLGFNAKKLFEKSNIGKLRIQRVKKLKTMNNYFGIGIDGAVSIAFDHMRKHLPGLFIHKIINKVWYALLGIRTFLFGRNKDLSKNTKIICDGKTVDLPNGIKGILVVNINSYAGGTKLWNMPKPWEQQKMNDGVVEIVGFTGLPHLGQVKAGLAKAIPIAQGRQISIHSFSRVPMQLDGEPWLQNPCQIDICLSHQEKILQPDVGL